MMGCRCRFFRDGNGIEIETKDIGAAIFRADRFRDLDFVPPPDVFQCQRPVERVRVFHGHDGGQALAIGRNREALHHMQLVGMRCAEIIDEVESAAFDPDRIDDQCVAILVMADGIAEPGRFHIVRMLIG